jgi:putative isomerase
LRLKTSLLELLKDGMDIIRVPFSDRGSRLLVYQRSGESRLYVKLAERLLRVEPGLESYLQRPPYIDDLSFIDERGEALEFDTVTSAELLRFRTRIGQFELAFQDVNSLVFAFPDRSAAGIRFRLRPLHWHKTDTGGTLNHIRDLSYFVCNGRLIKSQLQNVGDESVLEFIVRAESDCSFTLRIWDNTTGQKEGLPFSVVRDSARRRWEDWFDSVPDVDEKYRRKYAYAWWVMANNLISPQGYVKYEAMMPTKAFYVGVWLWDSALHAIAYRHIDPELARDQIRVMLAHQLQDGMLPDVVFDEGIVAEIDHPIHGRVTKPPILAWSALKIHEREPNLDFLKEIYGRLVRCNEWWFEQNDDDRDGIVQYTHPYSSGLDDSPLWDHGMPVESPDINTYLHTQMMSLAEIAGLIGKPDEEKEWKDRAQEHLARFVEGLWDAEAGLFRAKHDKKPIPVTTPFNLYPLWTGQLPQDITKRLLDRLKDPAEFWGPFGLPTVAFNDPAFNPDKMWRGPVWANINYFFVEALEKVGEHQLAAELRDKTLDMINAQPDIREYYNPHTGLPPATAAPIFGWSAAVFIDLAIRKSSDTH